ncbi:hypothetical protein ACT80S_11030 [Ramlibacter sp. MAHUQ-53]|uniref:hypothetical protein n=1 Tax=unclassified Ramlibacter TaxID=2617605 RepID=UPI0036355F04
MEARTLHAAPWRRSVIALLVASGAACAQASQFFVFPVKELEGVSNSLPPEKRPLVDPRVRRLIDPAMQASILEHFAGQVERAFPDSVVHARQVRNVRSGGAYRYINNDSLGCAEGFNVPVQQSYAVVAGITRASWYQVPRERGAVELLVPITLNLQLVKPEKAKVVYSLSETLYSRFRFGSEAELQASTASIAQEIAKGLASQVSELVKGLQAGFKPKDATVRIVGQSQGVFVADKGFEAGFVVNDEAEAVNTRTGQTVLVRVLGAESRYAILKPSEGSLATGDELTFQFGMEADDSRKPRVMPVVGEAEPRASAIADLFAKDIGVHAGFQIAAVDANFKDTQASIEAKAACVPWSKFASVRKDFESRQDAPDFFLRFQHSLSPVTLEAGAGGVETRESFAATVTAQLVDHAGHVLFSEMGQDYYQLDKKGGRGLDLANAFEVSLKNATRAVAKKFVANVRFQPGEYEVSSASRNAFTVQGLALPPGTSVSFDVLRPLNVQVHGQQAAWRLALGSGAGEPRAEGDATVFSYTPLDTEVRRGDRVVIANMPRKGQVRMSECETPYVAPGSIPAGFLLPVLQHGAYSAAKLQVALADPAFYADANRLLDEGKFKLKLQRPTATEVCVRPGYLVKPEPPACQGDSCGFDMLAAATVILEKGAERVANFVQAEKLSIKGVAMPQVTHFAGSKAIESVSKNLPKLIEKLNATK